MTQTVSDQVRALAADALRLEEIRPESSPNTIEAVEQRLGASARAAESERSLYCYHIKTTSLQRVCMSQSSGRQLKAPEPVILSPSVIGDGIILGWDVIIGHPSKATLFQHRVIGNDLQTAHHVIIRLPDPPAPGHMGILPSAVGPEPIVRRLCGSLKVDEVLWRERTSGRSWAESQAALIASGCGTPLSAQT